MIQTAFQTNPRDFLDKCGAILEKDPVEHNLMLTLCAAVEKKRRQGEKTDIRCAVLTEDDDFVLGAVQMPTHNIVLSKSMHPDVDKMAEVLAKNKFSFPGIVGPSDVASVFSTRWTEITGQEPIEYMDQIIYALKRVVMPQQAKGEMRPARENEKALVAEWILGFSGGALPKAQQVSAKDAKAQAEDLVNAGRMMFWTVKDKPVAQASVSSTGTIARISRVYTPPENRGHGYASAVIAHLSQQQLDKGYKKCCLYADARNPVSNSIYRKVGYEFAGRSSLYLLKKS